jgi:hypothetical protein
MHAVAALTFPRLPRARRGARARSAAGSLVLALAALTLASCSEPPSRPTGPVLVLDVKLGQPFEMRTILRATLLLDGREVASFRQAQPESSVVFSRRLEGIAPGEHEVAVRLDEQFDSPDPVEHAAVGLATWGGQQLPLIDRAGPLGEGEAFRWRLALPPAEAPATGPPAATATPAASATPSSP